ncbi:AAA domain containing protein [uncultured Caudovirales phage]|uniref:AAA domain containing protein n=1 Tax=uncultured Caudovirales phage TaxID=2100421 RepID=A0A6J5LA07_9CAUD|nr:AAA domain containing protein [uncultured Caudovirales phage]
MSIALLVESAVEVGVEQTLLVPTSTDVLMFHRLSNGQRGRGQRWSQVARIEELPTSLVTTEPVGVLISGRDVVNAEMGIVTSLATKALGIKAPSTLIHLNHDILVARLRDQLFAGDQDLNKFVSDGRRTNPVVLKPIMELEPAFMPITSTLNQPVTEVTITTPSRTSALAPVELASVPDKKWAETYLHRKVSKGVTDFDVLDLAMRLKQNVLIRGHAGSGKTMCVLAWASQNDYRYYNISANVGLEPSHLFGAWTPTEQAGVFKWQDGPVTDLVRNGGVLLLNEIDFMPERITTVLFGLLDDRREIQLLENGGEVIKAHPDLIVIGDHNPNYRGSRPMNQAWKDRFSHKLEFDYDKAIERKLIKNEALLEVAGKLRQQADKGEIDTPVSTRGLIAFVKNVEALGLDYAVMSYINGFLDDEREAVKLVFDTAKANIGKGFGIEVTTTKFEADEEQN